jgi:hypothetical protein
LLDAPNTSGHRDNVPEVVELRVHGVGGSPPEGLLGVASASDCVQEAGDGETFFVSRRDDRRVQGYIWGALTERPLLQPLWLFLLPFTFVNVAGWMHRPLAELRGGWMGWVRLFRGLVLLIGAAFTASYFFWLANLVINRLYQGQTWMHFASSPRIRVALGGGIVLLLLGALYLVAGATQRHFEAFDPPESVIARAARSATDEGEPAPAAPRDIDLADPRFWSRPVYARNLLVVHLLVGVLATALVTATAWIRAAPEDMLGGIAVPGTVSPLGIAVLATYTTEIALWGIVGLLAVHLAGWGGARPAGVHRFRWLPPVTTATLGVAMGTMFIYALPLLFGAHSAGRVAVLSVSFGIGTLAAIPAGIGLAVWYVRRRREELRMATSGQPPARVPPDPPGRDGDEPHGATPAMYRRIAGSRTVSDAGRNATTLLTAMATAFLVSALLQFRFGVFHQLAWSVRIGEIIAAAGTGALLVFLVRNARKPNERRIVGILWDVLTFWPRRFHPFGVRPYAERAVPDIETRLVRLVRHYNRRVILSCHSQGTVLGYAALVQLPDDVVHEVAYLTYGAPLRQLYEMAFPAYFSKQDYADLRRRLFDDGESPPPSWRSFYRLTDYIGTTVFEDPTLEDPVPDPAEGPEVSDLPLDRPLGDPFPDPPRTAWSELLLHSYYNREPQLKAWLRELRTRMERQG